MRGPSPRLSLVFILADSTKAPAFTWAAEEPLVEQLARAGSARVGPRYAVEPPASLITCNLTSGLLRAPLFTIQVHVWLIYDHKLSNFLSLGLTKIAVPTPFPLLSHTLLTISNINHRLHQFKTRFSK